MEFEIEEKEKLFDEISSRYFNKNFGSMSKNDFETLIFSEYIEHCLRNNLDFDDYTISKELGITQSRVRTLKERKELKYPHKGFDWKIAFENAIPNAKYDENNRRVKIIIQDVNVMNELRHYIEEKGWYDEITLNKKLLQVPLDCFVDICMDLKNITQFSNESKNQIKKLELEENAVIELLKDFSKEGLKKFVMSATTNTLCLVLEKLSFDGLAYKIIRFINKQL
ncbi:MAG: hypothetical protein HFJ59_05000 [Clostridia bacterium]|nr:hypothetical protein [Clostridia bacterium]